MLPAEIQRIVLARGACRELGCGNRHPRVASWTVIDGAHRHHGSVADWWSTVRRRRSRVGFPDRAAAREARRHRARRRRSMRRPDRLSPLESAEASWVGLGRRGGRRLRGCARSRGANRRTSRRCACRPSTDCASPTRWRTNRFDAHREQVAVVGGNAVVRCADRHRGPASAALILGSEHGSVKKVVSA